MLISQVTIIYWTLKELSDNGIDGISLERLADEISKKHGDSTAVRYMLFEGNLSILRSRLDELGCVEEVEGQYYISNKRPFSEDPLINGTIESMYKSSTHFQMSKK